MVLRRKHSPSDKHYLYRLKDKEVLDYLSLMPAMEWCPYHYRGLECKCRKSINTWKTGKFGLGVQKEVGQRLIEYCQENALIIANTLFQQHKRRLYIWTSPDGQHQNQIDTTLI